MEHNNGLYFEAHAVSDTLLSTVWEGKVHLFLLSAGDTVQETVVVRWILLNDITLRRARSLETILSSRLTVETLNNKRKCS